MKRVLFICSQNLLRSPTAERIFSTYPGIEVTSAGLNQDAIKPVTPELVEWAELIFVMDQSHVDKLSSNFQPQLKDKHVVCLDIPDAFKFMDPQLIELLKAKVQPILPSLC